MVEIGTFSSCSSLRVYNGTISRKEEKAAFWVGKTSSVCFRFMLYVEFYAITSGGIQYLEA